MPYFNYHAKAKQLIRDGKLKGFFFADAHNKISPALVLVFNDSRHPLMPIRKERWEEYLQLIENLTKK